MPTLFDPLRIGPVEAKNRIFMAPMTRGRATADGVPQPFMATYYAQRADAGLIVTEATSISIQGRGWANAPGIYTDAHEAAWRPVTEAVHEAGGHIFLQLWHMGRLSHPDFQKSGSLPVSSSPVAAQGEAHTPSGKKPYVTPRALELSELPEIVKSYADAAVRAMDAGFDGVEIHGANGYLLDQFIRDGVNQRTDAYGGSIENRWRLPLEVIDAVSKKIGAARTAIRFSPTGTFSSMSDRDPLKTFSYGAQQLSGQGLAYVHLAEGRAGMMHNADAPVVFPVMKKLLGPTPLVINGGYDLASGQAVVASGDADAVAYGVPFLANPDLVKRYAEGVETFNPPDFSTFYSNDEKGYTDYPALGG